jgi:hypothetical protein
MRRSISIGTGAAVGAILTHGMVSSALNLSELLPISTYHGFFQHVLLAMERLWSYAHGWQPMSHIDTFGHFYAHTVDLICPLIGFSLFWMISRRKVGIELWKPVGIALLLTFPPGSLAFMPVYALGLGYPWSEVVRILLVLLSMAWSVGAIRISTPHTSATESPATA